MKPIKSAVFAIVLFLLSFAWSGCEGNGNSTLGSSIGGNGSGSFSSILLVTDVAGNKIRSNGINSDGTLSALGSGNTDSQPSGLAFVSGKFVLTANKNSTTVTSFTMPSTGTLTQNSFGNFSAGLNPFTIAQAPNGQLVIANSGGNTLSLESIDSSGNLTQINSLGLSAKPQAMTFVGSILYVSTTAGVAGYTVANNAITPLTQAVVNNTNFTALATSSGFLYAADATTRVVEQFSVNTSTGALTAVGSTVGVGNGPVAMTFDNNGLYLYVVNQTDATVSELQKDPTTGQLSAIDSISTSGSAPVGIAFDATNSLLFVSNSGSGTVAIFKVNLTSGHLTAIGTPVSMGTQPYGVLVATF